jgi:hypothetical protein
MIECEKVGFGCHYGAWYAATHPAEFDQRQKSLPDGWLVCKRCGKPFKPKTKRRQYYCEAVCQMEAQKQRDREKLASYKREWRAKKKEGTKD